MNGKPMRGPKDQQWDRAGRLVQTMWLLLQAGPGGLSIWELAEALPVSTRTILRDMDSLENARIPVIRTWGPPHNHGHPRRYFVLDLDARQHAAATRIAALMEVMQ